MDLYREIAAWTGWPMIVAVMAIFGGYGAFLLQNRISTLKERNEILEKRIGEAGGDNRPIDHYLLFFWRGEHDWAKADWIAAREYIAKFTPTCGFSRAEAAYARRVTIVGASSGIDYGAEEELKSLGVDVERLAGKNEEDTAELLRRRVNAGRAFEGGLHRLP